MGLISPDFSETIQPLPVGEYKARVVDSEIKQSKAGNTYVKWTMETFGDDNPKSNSRKIFHNTPATGGGAFRLAEFYTAATGGTKLAADAGDFDTEQLHTKELLVVMGEAVDQNGSVRAFPEVKSVRAII